MKVGFDWGGVLDTHGKQLSELATAMKLNGHEIYIVSAINSGEEERRIQQVEELMPDICIEIITLVAEHQNQPLEKLKIVLDKKIDMFFDDRSDICELLQNYGVLAFTVPKVNYL